MNTTVKKTLALAGTVALSLCAVLSLWRWIPLFHDGSWYDLAAAFCCCGLLVLAWYGVARVFGARKPLAVASVAGGGVWVLSLLEKLFPSIFGLATPADWRRMGFAALGVLGGIAGLWLLLWLMKRFPGVVNSGTILYVVFGVLTTAVDFIVFGALRYAGLSKAPAQVVSWVAAVTFAYLTNRVWVFASRVSGLKAIATECARFFAARLLSMGLQVGLLLLCVDLIGWSEWPVKIATSVVVLVVNYIASKVAVFKEQKPEARS